ncbi:WecB/TagA/CpsF family glycosyltransferase [Carboxylicivirga marina]|uniref:WecB/TagA/CpsF family glycosyltransferase n=1 Tax=Carboxylicivirga marina TaxID=2800988 RepID=UPI002598C7D1|nr:WecB/TagA/CpsF family glycosyltransferase [uncultured Carboxylicivirga sp.]
MEKINIDFQVRTIFGIPIASLTMKETLELIDQAIKEKKTIHHVVVNAGKIVAMQSDDRLNESVLGANLINVDGQAVVWASKIVGKPLPERVAGIDLMDMLVRLCSEKGYRSYFLGARQEVVEKVVKHYSNTYSEKIIAGYHDGYYNEVEEERVAHDIAKSNADILFVAITSPKKEIFLNKYKHIIKIPFVMGVGGSFDVVAGVTKRAPLWMQKIGLEWFFRFSQEPKRMWKRYLVGNSKFIMMVLKEKLKSKY